MPHPEPLPTPSACLSRRTRPLAACLLAWACAPTWAAHPLQSEDTGTQGPGNVEWENGLGWTRAAGVQVFSFQPQLSYGIRPEVDLILQPSWLRQPDARGRGDTQVDVKWRFFGESPLSLGVRAGFAVPSGNDRLGLPPGTVAAHGVLIATYDEAPWTVHANIGMDRNPATSGVRRHLWRVSTAVQWTANDRLVWALDAGVSADPDPARRRRPATLLAGAVYTLSPGLDVDVGYQVSIGAQPSARQWLAGLTYRFAP
ncbi:MAG: transporter [Burkholderiales bacterium]|nr:MAG: transporter [Burkholderiales bacterium]